MLTETQIPVRYGRTYRVVLAIVLPCFSIPLFIWAMQGITLTHEWQEYTLIYAFLGLLAVFVLWLVKNIYPPALLTIGSKNISLSFSGSTFLKPNDFTVNIEDVSYFNTGDMGGDDYIRFETQNPRRKFQLSARSYSEEDDADFKTAMWTLSEMLNP